MNLEQTAADHNQSAQELEELIADGRRLRALNQPESGWLVIWDEGSLIQDRNLEKIGEALELLNGTPETMNHLRAAIDRLIADQAAAARQTNLEL